MLNRIVELGLNASATERQLDDAVALMGDVRSYVTLSPARPRARRGSELAQPGAGLQTGVMTRVARPARRTTAVAS